MITTPEIICDVFSFLDKNQIERIQFVNQFWNNVIIRHQNIWPLRQFALVHFISNQIYLYATEEERSEYFRSYIINFDGTNLSKFEVSSRYSQLTVDEVLTNLNDVVFYYIRIQDSDSEDLDNLLNLMKIVTTKTGSRFRGRYGKCYTGRFGSKLDEIFDNYIIVDKLTLGSLSNTYDNDSYIREVCADPEIVQLPSTPKEIRFGILRFKENEEVMNFTCNGKLNGANRLTIFFKTFNTNYENFIRQWFELYRTHENPISLVGKFATDYHIEIVLDAVKTFLNNTQLRVKYSLETKEFRRPCYPFTQYFIRHCVLHETDSYALVIQMVYEVNRNINEKIDMRDLYFINASDLDRPSYNLMQSISFCVKSL